VVKSDPDIPLEYSMAMFSGHTRTLLPPDTPLFIYNGTGHSPLSDRNEANVETTCQHFTFE